MEISDRDVNLMLYKVEVIISLCKTANKIKMSKQYENVISDSIYVNRLANIIDNIVIFATDLEEKWNKLITDDNKNKEE